MVSDDFTALAAITMGALASSVVTWSLATRDVEPPPPPAAVEVVARAEPCGVPGQVLDFAIIRSGGVRVDGRLMVGPEGERSGWRPESLELRLLRGR